MNDMDGRYAIEAASEERECIHKTGLNTWARLFKASLA